MWTVLSPHINHYNTNQYKNKCIIPPNSKLFSFLLPSDKFSYISLTNKQKWIYFVRLVYFIGQQYPIVTIYNFISNIYQLCKR